MKKAIEREISAPQQQLDGINAQIKKLGFVDNISRDFLDRHSALKARIDALKNQKQVFLIQNELQVSMANADAILKRSIEDILRENEDTLNSKMKEFNESLLFKNLGQDIDDGIICIYNSTKKQIFIAYDKQSDWRSETQKTLKDNCVLRLSTNNCDLYGRSLDTEE